MTWMIRSIRPLRPFGPWLVAAVLSACTPGRVAPAAQNWVPAWTAAADSDGPALAALTLRHVLRASIGGHAVRIRLSNRFGTGPVTLGPVHVALRDAGPGIRVGTDRALTFDGQPTVTIPAGQSRLSDAAALDVGALQELAVSLYVPGATGPSTIHGNGKQTVYVAKGVDATGATVFPLGETDDSRYFVTEVDVAAAGDARALVAMGDSITDGIGSTPDGNARWPDALAARLQADPATTSIAVADAGIAGNRLLRDGVAPYVGPSGLSRLDRDAIDLPGVRWLVLLQGLNDITASRVLPAPSEHVTVEQIIEGMKSVVARAHARGVQVWGATLLPRGGTAGPRPHTPAAEADRQAVNAWIRGAGAFDRVLDFERVVQDPEHPDRLRPDFDSGDHTHPNDAGYRALAASIDPRWFGTAK
jgi:lysophospholipase L1-like esterase